MPEVVEMRTFNLTSLASNWRQPKLRHSYLMASLHHCRRIPRDQHSVKAVGSSGSRDPSGGGRMQHCPRVMHIILLSTPSVFCIALWSVGCMI